MVDPINEQWLEEVFDPDNKEHVMRLWRSVKVAVDWFALAKIGQLNYNFSANDLVPFLLGSILYGVNAPKRGSK